MATTVETTNAVTNITVTTGTQNVFSNIATDSGTVVVDSTVDTLTFTGCEGIDTAGTPGTDTITISGEDASTSNKGIASFSSSNFDVSSGAVSLKANGINDTHLDFGTGTNQINTDDLTEGSTNLYFTNGRADARIAAATIDADSTTIQNLEVDNLKSGVLDTDISSVAGTDTTLASAKAIKTYVDSQILTKDNSDEIAEGSTNLYFTNARADARVAAASIDALTDVDITTSAPSNNQVLLFNTSSGKFVPGQVSSGAGYQSTSVITDLTDHSSSGAFAEGQIFVYDASFPTQFVNRTLSGAITLDGDGVTALATDTVNDTHIDFGTGTNQVNTDDLPEGSTNEYFTTARARASISASGSLAYNSSTGALTYTQAAIDADSVTISNIEVDNFKSGVLDTDISSVAGTDTTLASAKAIKTYVDAQVATKDNSDEITEGSTNLYFTNARAEAVSINNLSEDTTPQLGGDLDVLASKITSSSSNVVISADTTDKDVIIKVKDAGATLQTAGTFSDYDYIENTTNGDSGTATTRYDTVLDIDRGIRIGSTANEFSSTGASPNNNNAAYNLSGIIVGNTGNTWPAIDIISNGQATDGSNPLRNQLGDSVAGGLFTQFPNGQLNFKASNGTVGSIEALGSGKRMGQMNFYGHDTAGYGGASAVPSIAITGSANETFSTSNSRGGKFEIEILPTGGSASDGDGSSDRRHIFTAVSDSVKIGDHSNDNKYIIVDSDGEELFLNDIRLNLGQEGRVRADDDVDIRLDPQGSGIVRMETAVRLDNQSGDPSGSSDASHIYAKDDSGSSEVFVRDEAGNVTKISPHNEAGEWEYFSRNTATGKTVRVNMEAMIKDIEQLTGKTYIENE